MGNKNILFVCMGNICRSPAAEAVMKNKVHEAGLDDEVFIDSAGTIGYHSGEHADERMIKHAAGRGYSVTSISRKFNPTSDFDRFDYIVTMDEDNFEEIKRLDQSGKYGNKLFRFTGFNTKIKTAEVPDPYYGESKEFENVLDIIEDGCSGLLERLKNEIK